MTKTRKLAPVLLALLPAAAYGQTTELGRVQVDADRTLGSGYILPEEAPKSRSTATREALDKQIPTANPYQNIQQLPGVNAFSNDPTGLFGGTFTMRGFNSDQIGFTVDGAPLNDSGNYAVYPGEYVDGENLDQIYVTQGSPDVDAPHGGATGGNLGIVSTDPTMETRVRVSQTIGQNNLRKTFVRLDTGRISDVFPLRAFVSYSKADADKWRGKGGTDRHHVDAKFVYEAENGIRAGLGLIYNRQLTSFYRDLSLADYRAFGRKADFNTIFPGLPSQPPRAGVVQDDSTANFVTMQNTRAIGDYYGLNINPYENALVTGKVSVPFGSKLRADLDTYYWYGHGSGIRGIRFASESAYGVDFNGDGDKLDKVAFAPNALNYNFRPGATLRVTWQPMDGHRLTAGFWYERARLVRNNVLSAIDSNGNVIDPWAEKALARGPDGSLLNDSRAGTGSIGTNYFVRTTTAQPFVEYSAAFLQDRLKATVGVRRPHVERNADDRLPYAVIRNPSGSWQAWLPNASLSYQLAPEHQLFASAARTFRAPAVPTLFDADFTGSAAQALRQRPETAWNYEAGYRYQGDMVNASVTFYLSRLSNRQFSYNDPVANTNFAQNIGRVHSHGVEMEVGTKPWNGFSIYGSLTYNKSTLQDDLLMGVSGGNVRLPLKGKTLANTPEWMAAMTLQYQRDGFFIGLQPRWVSGVYSTLVNDERIPSFTVTDLFMGYELPKTGWLKGARLQLNVSNLFDKNYITVANNGQSSRFNAQPITQNGKTLSGNTPLYTPGPERFVMVSLRADF